VFSLYIYTYILLTVLNILVPTIDMPMRINIAYIAEKPTVEVPLIATIQAVIKVHKTQTYIIVKDK
jgi:hypothetical protein